MSESYNPNTHPTDLGTALSANGDALLNRVNHENRILISHLQNGTLSTHIRKNDFLNSLANTDLRRRPEVFPGP